MDILLQNAKVRLRPLAVDDAVHYARLLGDDWDTIKTTGTIPCPCTEAAAREWLEQRLSKHEHFYAILRQSPDESNDEFVGAISLTEQADHDFEVGYWIGRVHAGNGYATAAVQAIIALARSLKLPKLIAGTFPENETSAHILKKAGFVYTHTAQIDFPLRGGLRASNEYELNLT